jgi:hydroxymethylbilane synthase
MGDRIAATIPPEVSLPAGGQGAVGVEYRADDSRVAELLAPLNHDLTARCVRAERACVKRLDGGCDVPIASYAELRDGNIWLRALVGATDGSELLLSEQVGTDPEVVGIAAAEELLSQGADALLAAARA